MQLARFIRMWITSGPRKAVSLATYLVLFYILRDILLVADLLGPWIYYEGDAK